MASRSHSLADDRLGDILVTATRRPEPVSEIPASIGALDWSMLEGRGIHGMEDIGLAVPGVTFTPGWGGSSQISIRGIASDVGAGTTAIYLNDVPIQIRALGSGGTSTNAYPLIFDLERIEILRGPQGTLFGASAEGGAIRFIPTKPSLEHFTSFSRAELSSVRGGGLGTSIGSSLSGPLRNQRLAFKISAYYESNGGWVDRVNPLHATVIDRNANSRHAVAVNGALLWQPSPALKITPSIYYQKTNQHDTALTWRQISDSRAGKFYSGQPLRQPSTDAFSLYTLAIEYETGFATLTSNTAYFDRRNPNLLDYTVYTAELLGLDYRTGLLIGGTVAATTENRQKSFTQEIRLHSSGSDGLQWVAGIFYQNANQHASEEVSGPNGDAMMRQIFGTDTAGVFGTPLLPGDRFFVSRDTVHEEQLAAYGQLDLQLSSRWKATAGLRVAAIRMHASNRQDGPFNGGASSGESPERETPVLPKFSLAYSPGRDALLYVSAAKGFRGGGGNIPVPLQTCAADLVALGLARTPESYKSDSVWSYEAGLKATGLQQHLKIEGSVFRIDWKDIQNAVPLQNCGFSYIANLGSARSQGFDIHVATRPLPGLSIAGTLSRTDTKYTKTVYGGALPTGGKAIIAAAGDSLHIPPWAAVVSADYIEKLGGPRQLSAYLHGEFRYRAGFRYGGETTVGHDPLNTRQDAIHTVSLRAGIRTRHADASLFVDNAFNAKGRLAAGRSTVGSALFREAFQQPFTAGMRFSWRY